MSLWSSRNARRGDYGPWKTSHRCGTRSIHSRNHTVPQCTHRCFSSSKEKVDAGNKRVDDWYPKPFCAQPRQELPLPTSCCRSSPTSRCHSWPAETGSSGDIQGPVGMSLCKALMHHFPRNILLRQSLPKGLFSPSAAFQTSLQNRMRPALQLLLAHKHTQVGLCNLLCTQVRKMDGQLPT